MNSFLDTNKSLESQLINVNLELKGREREILQFKEKETELK